MTRSIVDVPGTPKAGPYSDAVKAGELLFISGKVGFDSMTSAVVPGGIAAETRQAIANAAAVLAAAGLTLDDVVKCNVYLTSMDDFAAMNEAYGEQFRRPAPARTTVAVSALPLAAAVEIEMVAMRPTAL